MAKKRKAGKSAPGMAKKRFHIAALGGSAGSLEAFRQFFTAVPLSSGIAFVVIAHLDPAKKDHMAELLQHVTKIPVSQADEGMQVFPNRIYVIPPNKNAAILNNRFKLYPPALPHGLNMPIDFFFRRLAKTYGELAAGIIFSGMGTDGTAGLKAIKKHHGLVLTQSPDTAAFSNMPKSAIETGLVDGTAVPKELPSKLLEYLQYASTRKKGLITIKNVSVRELRKIYAILQNQTGHDFSSYKKSTFCRRIEKRMGLNRKSIRFSMSSSSA